MKTMNEKTNNTSKEPVAEKPGQRFSIKGLLDGTILTKEIVIKQLPYILFVIFLAIVYIGNRFHAEQVLRRTVQVQRELKDMRAESISIASELINLSNHSQVSKLIREKSLSMEEKLEPPAKIVVPKNNEDDN